MHRPYPPHLFVFSALAQDNLLVRNRYFTFQGELGDGKRRTTCVVEIAIDRYVFGTWEHERKSDVLEKVVGDFVGWDKDANKYAKAFDKLLKGLQAGDLRP